VLHGAFLIFNKNYDIINYTRNEREENKMITAKEAKRQTNQIQHQLKEKAVKWVEDEWEFVDNKIKEAISKGLYETSYWWSNELLKEVDIHKNYAAEALAEKAYSLGFVQEIWKNYSNQNVLRIEVRWERA
jgi:hypothetical protein